MIKDQSQHQTKYVNILDEIKRNENLTMQKNKFKVLILNLAFIFEICLIFMAY
jgi:hypothetical protein